MSEKADKVREIDPPFPMSNGEFIPCEWCQTDASFFVMVGSGINCFSCKDHIPMSMDDITKLGSVRWSTPPGVTFELSMAQVRKVEALS